MSRIFKVLFVFSLFLFFVPNVFAVSDGDVGVWDSSTNTWKSTSDMNVDSAGDVIMGRSVDPVVPLGVPSVTPDFFWHAATNRFFSRSMILEDTGDPPDIAIRRNDGAYPDGARAPIGKDVNIGTIYWQPWDGTSFNALTPSGTLATGRIAQVYARARSIPSQSDRAGSLHLATTRSGKTSPTDTLVLSQEGTVVLQQSGSSDRPVLTWDGELNTGIYKRSGGEVSTAVFGDEGLRVTEPSTNTTGIFVITNRDGARDVQRVEIGPVNSGGAGYRSLRIAN